MPPHGGAMRGLSGYRSREASAGASGVLGSIGIGSLEAVDGTPALILDLVAHRAAREVIVHEPTGLHQRVRRRRPDEAKAAALQLLGERLGLGGRRRDVVVGAWHPILSVG